jgi:hypothetical protein
MFDTVITWLSPLPFVVCLIAFLVGAWSVYHAQGVERSFVIRCGLIIALMLATFLAGAVWIERQVELFTAENAPQRSGSEQVVDPDPPQTHPKPDDVQQFAMPENDSATPESDASMPEGDGAIADNPFAMPKGGGLIADNPFAMPTNHVPMPEDDGAIADNPFANPAKHVRMPADDFAGPAGNVSSEYNALAEVPLVAKLGIFAGFLVVGWFLLNRR